MEPARFTEILPLLEREHELDAIGGAFDRLAAGAGALLVVEGPAGIGKTRLLVEAARLAGARGLLVRHARGIDAKLRDRQVAPNCRTLA
jgi:MoxR-like ATPase